MIVILHGEARYVLFFLFSRKHFKYLLIAYYSWEVGISAQLWFGQVCVNVLTCLQSNVFFKKKKLYFIFFE